MNVQDINTQETYSITFTEKEHHAVKSVIANYVMFETSRQAQVMLKGDVMQVFASTCGLQHIDIIFRQIKFNESTILSKFDVLLLMALMNIVIHTLSPHSHLGDKFNINDMKTATTKLELIGRKIAKGTMFDAMFMSMPTSDTMN